MRCWTGFLRFSTMLRHDAGVVWRARSLRCGSQRRQEVFLLQAEIVHRQTVCFSRVLQAELRILGHDVNLSHLILVMKFERLEVRGAEVAPLSAQADGHGRAEHCQSLVQANDLLFVQPEQGAVEQLVVIFHAGFQLQVGADRLQEFSERGFGLEVRPPAALRQAGE